MPTSYPERYLDREPRRHHVRSVLVCLLVALLAIGGYLAYKLRENSPNVQKADPVERVASATPIRRVKHATAAAPQAVPWISSAELMDLYHRGYVDASLTAQHGLTVRGMILAVEPEIFDGIHAVIILQGAPGQSGYVRAWFQKTDRALRGLAPGQVVNIQPYLLGSTKNPASDSLLLFDCRVLSSRYKLGRNIGPDIVLGRPIQR